MSHDYADPQFIAEPAIAALINGIPSQSRLLCYIIRASKALHKEATYSAPAVAAIFLKRDTGRLSIRQVRLVVY
jgi:hypothetical protein